jgi:hypothetical protein
LMFEWDTLFPLKVFVPFKSHTRAMIDPLVSINYSVSPVYKPKAAFVRICAQSKYFATEITGLPVVYLKSNSKNQEIPLHQAGEVNTTHEPKPPKCLHHCPRRSW